MEKFKDVSGEIKKFSVGEQWAIKQIKIILDENPSVEDPVKYKSDKIKKLFDRFPYF